MDSNDKLIEELRRIEDKCQQQKDILLRKCDDDLKKLDLERHFEMELATSISKIETDSLISQGWTVIDLNTPQAIIKGPHYVSVKPDGTRLSPLYNGFTVDDAWHNAKRWIARQESTR